MARVGSGIARTLVDSDGDAVTVTSGRLDVNATIGIGSSTFTTYAQDTATTSAQTVTALIATGRVQTCKEIIIQADFTLSLPVSDTDDVSVRAPDSNQKLNISIIT